MFIKIIQDTVTGSYYKLVPEYEADTCEGCAFEKDNERCVKAPLDCGRDDSIFVEM